MSEIQARINDLVSNFVSEITRLARSAALDTLNRALVGVGGPAPRASAAPRAAVAAAPRAPSARRDKGAKRAKAEIAQLQEQVLGHIKSNPGQRIEQINKVLGTKTSDLALPLKKLIADGAVSTKGVRRATSYFPGDGSAAGGAKKRRSRGK